MGLIQLEEMEFYAFHGHYKEEQIVGNKFLVDLSLETDMEKPAKTDELDDALNYQTAYRIVKREMAQKSKLLEHLANRILDSLFEELPAIKSANLKIQKMNPPVGGKMRSVSVSMKREK